MAKIYLKTKEEIELLAEGGEKLARIVDAVAGRVRAGITTAELEGYAVELIAQSGGQSTFKGFHGYPAVSCISVNEEVVHGIPGPRRLNDGDIVGVDIGLRYRGWCTDMAVTVPVGRIDPQVQELLDVTRQSLVVGLEQVKPGNRIGDIAAAIQEYIQEFKFGIVRDLTGHGIGREPHEEPSVPNFGRPGTGVVLEEGMVLAIEPMVTLGKAAVKQLDDGWTISTLDGSMSAHFEHTVAVTADGCRILTQLQS